MTEATVPVDDEQVDQIVGALTVYQANHPESHVDVVRRRPYSIHIRIIDPDFEGIDWDEREPEVWKALEAVDDETFQNITVLLLLAPSETERSFANMEFENPVPSRLSS